MKDSFVMLIKFVTQTLMHSHQSDDNNMLWMHWWPSYDWNLIFKVRQNVGHLSEFHPVYQIF